MKKPRGQLLWRKGGWSGRYRTVVDGEKIQVCVPLGTENKTVAQVKLDRLISGEVTPEAVATEAETFEEAARRIVPTQGLITENDRMRRLETYVFPSIGERAVTSIKAADIRAILEDMVKLGLSRDTVSHVLYDISGVLKELWEYDMLPENPAKRVKVPKNAKTDGRSRVVLTDEEFSQFISWTDLDPELRLLALMARCFGGMRTSDLHAWNWSHCDLVDWADAHVPRPKTKSSDRLDLPEMIVPYLKAWWQAAGCPSEGLVFPQWRRSKGKQRTVISHARRLRTALWRAGVRRGPTKETCALQTDTKGSRRVDFHSFRRAFATALATAGVNVQLAMRLAGHRNPQTHMRYVSRAQSVAMPAEALPDLTCAPPVHTLKDRDALTTEYNKRYQMSPMSCSGPSTSRNYSALLGFNESNGPRGTETDPTVHGVRAHARAADFALSSYLQNLASSLAGRFGVLLALLVLVGCAGSIPVEDVELLDSMVLTTAESSPLLVPEEPCGLALTIVDPALEYAATRAVNRWAVATGCNVHIAADGGLPIRFATDEELTRPDGSKAHGVTSRNEVTGELDFIGYTRWSTFIDGHVERTMAHEIGHALGCWDHTTESGASVLDEIWSNQAKITSAALTCVCSALECPVFAPEN
jgi:integrase